jgi:hypothetical protein
MVPSAIDRVRNDDLGMRVGEMVLNLEQMAVPVSGSLWTRARLMGGARPGTIMGEGIRSFAMYKTFLINSMYQYAEELGMRSMAAAKDAGMGPGLQTAAYLGGKFGWPVAAFIPLTLAGALTVQLKQLARGNDPIYMGTPKFWGAAMLQGGSFGILGDFFYSPESRTGHTAGVVGAGPVGDLLADVKDTATHTYDLATNPTDEKTQHLEVNQLAQDVRKYTPGASLWWARAAFNRGIVDQLQLALDPQAKASFARAAQHQRSATGQESWWPQGEPLPTRAPNLATAVTPP